MKKLLLSVTILMLGIVSVNATTDPALYSVTTNGYLLKSLWFQSYNQGNLSPSMCPAENNARSMAVANGKILICRRDGSAEPYTLSIDVFDAATGNFIKNQPLASNVFKDANGNQVAYGCNDIRVDDAGHVLVCNLCTDNTTKFFQVWNVNIEDGTGTKVIDYMRGGTGTFRFETFDAYGDVTGNGYIITANGGGANIFRWEIAGGVVAATPTNLSITFYPTNATTPGNESRILAIDSQKFYLDGKNTFPTLYTYDGSLSSISMVSSFGDANAANKPTSTNRNGMDQFTINGKTFLTYTNTDPSNASTPDPMNFKLVELGANQSFVGSTNYYDYPGGDGLYKKTSYRWVQTVYSVVDNSGKTASLYLYGPQYGLAAYQFGLTPDVTTANANKDYSADKLQIISTENGVKLSETANVVVFNLQGQIITKKENVNFVALSAGTYIVKAIMEQRNVAVEKVIVK
jgi:hypothetical protein